MYGRLLIKVIKATNLYSSSDDELPSPFCKLRFGKHNIAATKPCPDTTNPVWNETFHFPVNKLSNLLEIKVRDAKTKNPLGIYILSIEEIKLNSNIEKTYILQKKEKNELVSGSITLKIAYLTNESVGSFQVQIIEAVDLRCKKETPTYVVLKYGSQKLKTSLSKSSLNPTWNETFSITMWGPNKFKLIVVKKNRAVIGYTTVNLLDYKEQFNDVITLPIRKRKKLKGDIKIKLSYKGNIGTLLADYSEEDSESVDESSYDHSIESSEQTSVLESSVTDSSISTNSDVLELVEHNETVYISINKAQCIQDNPKEEYYFTCSSNESSFASYPQTIDNKLIVWDESFHMHLSSLSEPFSINFFNKKYKYVGSTIISLNEINLDSFMWLDVIPNGPSCDISKIYANISVLPKEKDDISYDISATVVSIVNVKNDTPIIVKCSSTSDHVEKSTGIIRSNDNKLEIRETFTFSIKSIQEEYIFSVYKISRSKHKLLGSYVLDARVLNEKNNYFIDNWFTLQSGNKGVPNIARIRLKVKAYSNKLGLFNKYNRTHDVNLTEKSADMVIKLAVIGPPNSGKTSIMNRFVDDEFNKNSLVTIIDFKRVVYNLEGEKIMVIIKDTSGMERFAELTDAHYRNVDGMFVVFDKCEDKSLERAIAIYKKALESFQGSSCMLLGNKCENLKKVQIERKVGERFAEDNNIKYKEVSAKENINVHEAFNELLEEIYHQKKKTLSEKLEKREGIVKLEDSHIEKKRCCIIL